jgi:collagenase-like PrtC family protease
MKTLLTFPLVGILCVFCISCSKPEDKIVNHIEKVEKIMESNMDSPEKGVKKLIDYFEDNGSDAAAQLVELGIELAKIEGKGDREKRVKEITEAFETTVKNFEGTSEKFEAKVKDNKEATQLMKDYAARWEEVGTMIQKLGSGVPF